jgi:aldose 1-epimerase
MNDMKMEMVCEKLTNNNGMEVTLLNLGATLTGVCVPNKDGGRTDLTLGYDSPEDYIYDSFFFGATPGRYANRIGRGRFILNGQEYQLTLNEGRNQLHGGENGFAKKYWQASKQDSVVTFTYHSEDGENGYPGALAAKVAYSLNDENELVINYSATSDADTIINLTNHAYFNLNGGSASILDHELCLNADSFIVTDKENIPTGEIRDTAGTSMDLSFPRRLRDVVFSEYEPIQNVQGLDSCFALNGEGLRRAAVLSDPASGRTLEVDTDMPGVQIYSGQGIPEGTKGRGGLVYGPYSGVCLEAQNHPDAPNHPHFPSAVLKKGAAWKATIVFRFSF